MSIPLTDAIEALTELVKQGKIWAKCPKCIIPLSFDEFKKRKCETCGKIKIKGKEHITFWPKTDMC